MRLRGPDIRDLDQHFLETYKLKHHRKDLSLSRHALEVIQTHDWPGNVRQLQHSMERAVLLAEGSKIEPGDIFPGEHASPVSNPIRRHTLSEQEALIIKESIQRNGGNLSKAARELGVARSTLYNKMKNYRVL